MADKNTQFYAILTNIGTAKQANADALGIPWKITQMGVGDANGAEPTPNATQKTLINEWRRAPLNQLKVDDNDPSIIVAEQVIPADIGGKWIREIGLYDEAGDLVAVANCAPTYKPLLSQGSGRTQVLRMSLVVSNAASVQLKIDPSVVLATREWVTEELSRQDFKHSVLVATTAGINLSGLQTIDGVTLTAGARVLVKNQATAKENGIYTVVSGGVWKRSTDADTTAKVTPGLLVLIESGMVNGDSGWQLVTDAPITLGVTALSFEMAFGRTGVNAGTYKSVQVDKYGRVVSATNPTTVAGYGITDVYTKSETYNRTEISKAIFDAVSNAVSGLVDSAPSALDTLKELATAIGNDPNFAASMVNELAKKANLISPKFSGSPETPTPSASSTGLQIANMSALATAVAASARQFKTAVIGVSTNTTLTAAQMGNAVQFNGGAVTLALPSVTDVGNGASVMLRNPSATAAQNIVVASSGSIVDAGTTGGSFALKPMEWAELASSGSAWFVVGRGKLKEVAELDSPVFTGSPEVPTAPLGSVNKLIANMAAVVAAFQAFGLGTTIGVTIPDFDGVTESGLYRAEGTAKSSPFPNASMALLHIQFNQTGCFQLAAGCSSNISNARLFWRTKAGGSWADWQTVARLDSPGFTGTPTAPTAALGTNSSQISTMAALLQAVNAFKRSYSGNVVGVGADITLTGAQTGYAFNATAPVTITLPASSEAGSGGTFVIRNVSSGVVTVATTSGKVFEKNNTVAAAAIQPGEWIELQASTTNYFINQRGTLNEIGKVIADAMASFGIGGYNVKSGVDINTLTQGGLAYCINPTNSPVGTDGQSSANGYLLSFQYMDGTAYCAQVFIPSLVGASLDTMHYRRMTAGNWGGWNTLATTNFVELAFKAVGLGTNVAPLCADVDAQATSGFFYVATKLSANMPLESNGFLLQFPWNGSSAALQIYVAASVDKFMFRAKSSGNWRPWKDIPSLDGVIGAINNSSRSFRTQAATGIAQSLTLNTTTHMGSLLQFNADGLTVTLPVSTGVADGTVVTLRNPRASAQTLAASSGGIVEEGGTASKMTLQPYEWVELTSSSTVWFVSARGKVKEAATVEQLQDACTPLAPLNSPALTGKPTAPTQKVNDASKLLATTEFVELSKRNYSGPVLGFSSSMSLSVAQSGRLYQANANNLTVTLPAAVDAAGGTAYAFRHPSGGTLSIKAASGSIVSDVTLGTLVLQSGEYVELVSNTNTGWFVSSRGKLAESPTVDAMNAAVTAAAPPGQVAYFACESPPTGWLKRNGAAYSRTAYPALFAEIGTKFGAGNGTTTFNVPDDRELMDKAWTDGLNAADPGRVLFSTQAGQIESHNHTGYTNSTGAHQHTMQFIRERITSGFVPDGGNAVFGDQESDGVQTLVSSSAGAHNHTLNIGFTGGNENRVANRAYLACIKY